MKNIFFKKVIAIVMTTACCVTSNTAFAAESKFHGYSKIFNMSEEELQKISDIYGEEILEDAYQEYLLKDEPKIESYSLEDPNLPVEQISWEQYWEAISHGVKGQIWITKDGGVLPGDRLNHGHAGILYCYSNYYIAFVEHGGYSYKGNAGGETQPVGLSGISEWDNFEGNNEVQPPWKKVHTLRTYNVSTPTSRNEGLLYDPLTMASAADYAATKLIGYEYAPLSLKVSISTVNCATLVYKAYLRCNIYGGTSIELGNDNSPTVILMDLVEDNDLVLAYSAGWSGNAHEWNPK